MNSLEKARSEYLKHYRDAIARSREGHEKFASEILLELSDRVGLHRKLYRVDMISVDDGTNAVIEANLDQPTQIAETTENREQALVTIRPFAWNGAVFVARDGTLADVDPWFLRWADIEDENENDDDGLGGVIHSLHVTERGDAEIQYFIDFGSAPIDAFEDLLDLLVASGATTIDVSSPHFESKPGEQDGGGQPATRPESK